MSQDAAALPEGTGCTRFRIARAGATAMSVFYNHFHDGLR